MPPSDPELAEFAATGEEAAFRALVERHAGHLHAAAMRRLGAHAHLAADVTQQVFTKLACHARALPPDVVLGAWLHRQCQRFALNTVRAETRRQRREHHAAMNEPLSPAAPPPLASTLLPQLDEALDALSARDREVLILRYFEDRDLRGVAAALDLTPEAAKKRVSRALERLRALLTRRGIALSPAALAGVLTTETAKAAPSGLVPILTSTALEAATTSGAGAGFLTTLMMTHTTSALTGAAAGLLLTGVLYWRQAAPPISVAAAPAVEAALPPRPMPLAFTATGSLDRLVEEARTVEEIVEALRQVLNGPPSRQATLQAEMLMGRVPPADFLRGLKLADTTITDAAKTEFLHLVTRVWAAADPGAATRALYESDLGKPSHTMAEKAAFNSRRSQGIIEQFILFSTFQQWLERAPTEAVAWVDEVWRLRPADPSEPSAGTDQYPYHGPTLAGAVAEHLFKKDPHAAWEYLLKLPASWLERNGGLAQPLDAASPAELEAFLKSLGESSLSGTRLALLETLGRYHWKHLITLSDAATTEPRLRYEAGLAFMAADYFEGDTIADPFGFSDPFSSQGPTAEEKVSRRMDFLHRWAGNLETPLSAAQIAEVAKVWRSDHPQMAEAFLSWLRTQPGADDILIRGALDANRAMEMESRIRWAAAIGEEARRAPILRGLCRQWLDESRWGTRAFVEESNFPPEVNAMLADLLAP